MPLARHTMAIRLDSAPRLDGKLLAADRQRVTEALKNSIVHATFEAPENQHLTRPVVRLRSEPHRLLVELLTEDTGDRAAAMEWRIQNYTQRVFSSAIITAITRALNLWEQGRHDEAVITSWTGEVRTSAADRDAREEYAAAAP